MTSNKIQDQSEDKKYYIVTPQLVWAKCADPYEYTLWSVIKMIAGEKGECILSTQDLAAAGMMSMGKASTCRESLIAKGLLAGRLYRDPDYPQPVWHITIPDIWEENITWRKEHDSLKDRVEAKRAQRESLHLMKPSRGEEGTTPGEEGTTPGETKKNHVEPKEEPPSPGSSPPGEAFPQDSILPPRKNGRKKILPFHTTGDPVGDLAAGAALKQERNIPDWAIDGPEGAHPFWPVVKAFCEMTGQKPDGFTSQKGHSWLQHLAKLATDNALTVEQIERAHGVLPRKDWGQWFLANHQWASPMTTSYVDKLVLAATQIRDGVMDDPTIIRIPT